MILTFKIKHLRDFSCELDKAKKVVNHVLTNNTRSSKDVKQFGLKSAIANQILRKYGNNKTIKKVGKIKLTVPSQGIKFNKENKIIGIPCLKFNVPYCFRNDYEKINQIELDNQYAYVSINVKEQPQITPSTWLGLDRNTTGHAAVLGNPQTGKVWKFGKEALHIHTKYKNMRRELQKQGKYKLVKKIKDKESRIIKNINHNISKAIIETAKENNAGIKLEKLKGIRNNRKHSRKFNTNLHSWSFYQLQTFIGYKARLYGVPLTYIEPENTSKDCSRCGNVGIRTEKKFVCQCGHVDHADANASFNIALRPPIESIGRLNIENHGFSIHENPSDFRCADRDAFKGSTDTPQGATL